MHNSAHAAGNWRAAILITAMLCFAVPQATSFAEDGSARQADDPTRTSERPLRPLHRHIIDEPPHAQWRYDAIQWYFGVCAFIIGACVGSFLNVVIYRLPLGMGLLRADSHCPVCKMPIAFKDNVPIFAWLKLRGRCRECAARISPRYMFVELATALIFVMLAVVELFSAGSNLPGHALVNTSVSPLAALNVQLIGIYFTHCFLASALLCCVLIVADGHALPRSLIIPTLAVGLFTPFRAAPTVPLPTNWPAAGFTHAALGLVFGALLGALIGIGERYRGQGQQSQRNLMIVLAVIGCYLGWDAALFSAGLTAAAMLAVALLHQRLPFAERIPIVFFPALTAFLLIPFWNTWTSARWWPNLKHDALPLMSALAVLSIISLFARHLRMRSDTPHNALNPL